MNLRFEQICKNESMIQFKKNFPEWTSILNKSVESLFLTKNFNA